MRYCFLLITLIITSAAGAQFNFKLYGQAGTNYTIDRVTRTTGKETTNGGFGWQLGFGTEYHTKFGYFIYLGAGFRKENYGKDSISNYFPDTVSQFKYHPLFLSIPFGVGWQFPVQKDLAIKVYGGLNVQAGVSGKVSRHDLYYVFDSSSQTSVLARSEKNTHNLRFGRNSRKRYAYDYANSNWGINVGTGIQLKNAEVNVFYHHGFTNFLPNKDFAVEINKLSFFELNARFYFPNDYWSQKKRKRQGY